MKFEGKCPLCEGIIIDMDTPTMFEEIEIECTCDDCGSFFSIKGKYDDFEIVDRR